MSRTKYYRCDSDHDEPLYMEVGDEWRCADCDLYYCSEECYDEHKEDGHADDVACWSCGTTFPESEAVFCQGVRRYDETTEAVLETCERTLCGECLTHCSSCEEIYCSDHIEWCDSCEESYCSDVHPESCYEKHEHEFHTDTDTPDEDTTPIESVTPNEEVPEVEVMWE